MDGWVGMNKHRIYKRLFCFDGMLGWTELRRGVKCGMHDGWKHHSSVWWRLYLYIR